MGLGPAVILEYGVSFASKLDGAYKALLGLRTAERVSLEILSVKPGFERFRRAARRVPWEVYLNQGQRVSLITFSGMGKGAGARAGDTIQRIVCSRFEHLELEPPAFNENKHGKDMVLRLDKDLTRLFLDLTGNPMHKRGYRLATGPAPLRETIAAGLLLLCEYNKEKPLFDPMCGSGTVAIEAAMIARNKAPGVKRNFAVEQLPFHRKKMFENLKFSMSRSESKQISALILANDIKAGSVEVAKANAKRAGTLEDIIFARADFFKNKLRKDIGVTGAGLLAMNPPLGKRIGGRPAASALAEDITGALGKYYKGWKFGIVTTNPEVFKAVNSKGNYELKLIKDLPVIQGGLGLHLMYGKVLSR